MTSKRVTSPTSKTVPDLVEPIGKSLGVRRPAPGDVVDLHFAAQTRPELHHGGLGGVVELGDQAYEWDTAGKGVECGVVFGREQPVFGGEFLDLGVEVFGGDLSQRAPVALALVVSLEALLHRCNGGQLKIDVQRGFDAQPAVQNRFSAELVVEKPTDLLRESNPRHACWRGRRGASGWGDAPALPRTGPY